jgi:hypothetical protein
VPAFLAEPRKATQSRNPMQTAATKQRMLQRDEWRLWARLRVPVRTGLPGAEFQLTILDIRSKPG